jgi:cyclopropane fatty-acyl-phospholipid synthase-like methyltransferase
MTGKILKQIHLKNPQSQIANFGFGKGNESLLLARVYNAPVVAVEQRENYISSFEQILGKEKLENKIRIIKAPLDKLPFESESFDLIVSEGGTDYFDFGYRISQWKPYLKCGGYLAVSELCFLKESELRDELADYLSDNYPWREIETIDNNLSRIKESGYRVCGQHKFPESCWSDYFMDMSTCFESMPKRWKVSREGYQVEEYIEKSKYIHRMYEEWFCYVYFVMRKPLPAV